MSHLLLLSACPGPVLSRVPNPTRLDVLQSAQAQRVLLGCVVVLHPAWKVPASPPHHHHYHHPSLHLLSCISADGRVVSFVTQQYYTAVDDRTRELEQQIVTSIDSPLLGLLGANEAVVSPRNSAGTLHRLL